MLGDFQILYNWVNGLDKNSNRNNGKYDIKWNVYCSKCFEIIHKFDAQWSTSAHGPKRFKLTFTAIFG